MASVFDVGALEYKDEAGNTREAQGVFISSTPEYTDAAGNVRNATPVYLLGGGPQPEPFWEPFTVTAADIGGAGFGYSDGVAGSITNQPVEGYTVDSVINDGGTVTMYLLGPSPLASDALLGALVGVSGEDYSFTSVSSFADSAGSWLTNMIVDGVPEWTVGQQIPIVVIPQP